KDNKAEKPAPSKKEKKIDTVKKEVSQSPSKKVDAPTNLAKKDSQSDKANKATQSPAPVAAATPTNKIGRQLPNTGEVNIGIISILSLGLTLIGFLIVLAEKRRLRR
ncbi:MAG: LPXTG cell wall anchor domain-containing protein, partial [Abiotrophia defectiva]